MADFYTYIVTTKRDTLVIWEDVAYTHNCNITSYCTVSVKQGF